MAKVDIDDLLLQAAQVGQLLGVSACTALTYSKTHGLPFVETAKGHRRFRVADVLAFLNRRNKKKPAPKTPREAFLEQLAKRRSKGDDHLSIKEAATVLEIRVATVRNLIKQKQFSVVTIAGEQFVRWHDVSYHLNRQVQTFPAEEDAGLSKRVKNSGRVTYDAPVQLASPEPAK